MPEKNYFDKLDRPAPRLAGTVLYPIKGLDGVAVERARLLPSGALEFDRRWKIVDGLTAATINGKREPNIYALRAEYDLRNSLVTLWREGDVGRETLPLRNELPDRTALNAWLSRYFDRFVQVAEDAERGFPDDPKRPGPTLISEDTLEKVAGWFPGLSAGEVLRRMRTNLVIGGVPAFWEDGLYAPDESECGARLAFGRQTDHPLLEAVNPCLRCTVPTRDSRTGELTEHFATEFIKRRMATLPDGVARERFEKPFRLAVNTISAPGLTKTAIQVGQPITVCSHAVRKPATVTA